MFDFKGVREGHRPDGQPYIDSVRARAARHRLPGARGDRQLRVRGRTGRCSPASARTPMPASCCGSGPSAATEPQRRAPDLSRHRLRAGRGRAGTGAGRARGREPHGEPRRGRHAAGLRRTRTAASCASTPTSPASTCSPARPSRACSAPRWSAAPRASRSATSRSCSPTSRARPRSTSGSATSMPSSWSSSISTGCARPPCATAGRS